MDPEDQTLLTRRTYDADSVDRYLWEQRAALNQARQRLSEALTRLRQMELRTSTHVTEEMVGKAMLIAEQRAEEMVHDGRREATAIVTTAHQQAAAIVAAAHHEADETARRVRAESQRIVDEAHEAVRSLSSVEPSPSVDPT